MLEYLIIALVLNFLVFIPAYKLQTDKFTDITYSLTFIILVITALVINNPTIYGLVVAAMVTAWAVRLGAFLFIRIKKIKKDKRFDGRREKFWKFLNFWMLQGLAVWIILIPALFFLENNGSDALWIGAIIWLLGLLIEAIADFQKYRFKNKHKKKFIKSGLWRYSRHPNYFGEILCWIGIYVFAYPSLAGADKLYGLISPIFITILLLFVSGIPQVEKSAEKKYGKEYKEYKEKTSALIPWFVK